MNLDCECCGEEIVGDRVDTNTGLTFCRECADDLHAEGERMRAALPRRIALCPQCCGPGVYEDFYYPLAHGENAMCPTPGCGFEMVVYLRAALGVDREET
jgi:hypothetical protein